jgi:DNA modification methylase
MNGPAPTIIRGDALHLPLADGTVDLVVTSPPYFALRSYQDGGGHYTGQVGSEPTPAEFMDALLAATAEMVRVLKPSGSIFVNLGDKYATRYSSPLRGGGRAGLNDDDAVRGRSGQNRSGVPEKSLMGIPWRYALRCIDDLGLILRAEIIWSKPNGLPESVTDRVRRSHEQWFHFTAQPRYYSAVDEIREASAPQAGLAGTFKRPRPSHDLVPGQAVTQHCADRVDKPAYNPLGKLPGSVWVIPTQPLTVPAHLGVDHFAAFPMEWPRRIIRGWSPPGVCTGCGEGRRPVAEREANGRNRSTTAASDPSWQAINRADWQENVTRLITGYACACPGTTAPTTPAVVLDPFGGTGTTALVAHALGRRGISVDMSADYCRLARWRCNDRGQIAAAMEVDKPQPVSEDQMDLFGSAS